MLIFARLTDGEECESLTAKVLTQMLLRRKTVLALVAVAQIVR